MNLECRQAVEALRSGVPNPAAVELLGSAQEKCEQKFAALLKESEEAWWKKSQAPGFLIAGDFGSGKSHLLEHFAMTARENNFVCSKIVISKETPLFDLHKLFRAAVREARAPKTRGSALTELAAKIPNEKTEYADFYEWAGDPVHQLNGRFPASLHLYAKITNDEEMRQRIVSFWAGNPIGKGDLQRYLKLSNAATLYKLSSIGTKELALQRFRFMAQLIRAAGYAGWVLLLDEVELIGRYSLLQRARAYAMLALLSGKIREEKLPGLATVSAITSDYASAVMDKRQDEDAIPAKLGERLSGKEPGLIAQAQQGMKMIVKESLHMAPLKKEQIEKTYRQVKNFYARAYDCAVPDVAMGGEEIAKRMRQYVRRWINEWDLRRIYPGYSPSLEEQTVVFNFSENPELEQSSN